MAKKPDSIKSIIDGVRDRYYLEKKNVPKSFVVSEKSKVLKDGGPSAKDRESSTLEIVKGVAEKSTLSVSAGSPLKRVLKKGKKVFRKKGVLPMIPSKEEAVSKELVVLKQVDIAEISQIGNVEVTSGRVSPTEEATKTIIERGEKEMSVNLFSLNISEEVASIEAVSHQDEATSESLIMKKPCSRSPSQSSGEGSLKKRKITADLLIAENVAMDEAEKSIFPTVAEEGLDLVIRSEEGKESLTPPPTIQENVFEGESVAINNDPIRDLPSMDPLEADNILEELSASNPDMMVVPEEGNMMDAALSLQLLEKIPTADSILSAAEPPVTSESHTISIGEFLVLKAEMIKLKEELSIMKGELGKVKEDLGDARRELSDVREELNEMKARISEVDRSEHTINGAIYLFQKLVWKWLISPDVAMNPTLWSSP